MSKHRALRTVDLLVETDEPGDAAQLIGLERADEHSRLLQLVVQRHDRRVGKAEVLVDCA